METIISHYVRIDIKGDHKFEVFLVEETFDLGEYLRAQVKWSSECPYNRDAVRVKMGWSDEELARNKKSPSLLLEHFIDKHGDDWFRMNLRPRFIKVKMTQLEAVNVQCLYVAVEERCQKCELCQAVQLIAAKA